VAGYEYNTYAATTSVAKYWKNGIEVSLTDGQHYVAANSIYVSGNDVYVAGQEIITTYPNPYNFAAKYWKNGTEVVLSSGGLSSAYGIFVQ
jgi:hypothetical protein